MVSLEEWAILERDHVSSLVGAIADLEANTLRLPVTGGTKVYIVTIANTIENTHDIKFKRLFRTFLPYRRTLSL